MEERSAREIRQDIAAKRETISETVDKLGERIHQTLDWREYVGSTGRCAGLSAGVGFWSREFSSESLRRRSALWMRLPILRTI